MYNEAWEQLAYVLHSHSSLSEDWLHIVNFLFPNNSNLRDKYLSINYATDKHEIKEWIIETMKIFAIPEETIVIKIGIFDTVYQDKELSALSITGYTDYISNTLNDTESLVYEPKNRYFVPDGLNSFRSITRSEKYDSDFLLWIMSISYTAVLLKSIILENNEFPNHIKVVCGYTDGDYIEIPS